MRYPSLQFADDAGISQDLAERMLSAIYDHDELDVEDVNAVLWRLRDFIMKTKLPSMLDDLSDDDIEGVIGDMVAERKRMALMYPPAVCCAETVEDLQTAFNGIGMPESVWFFSQIDEKGKKTYKAGDIVTLQILKAGEWQHPGYGKVKITPKVIKDIVQNFKDNKRGIDLAMDENHDPDHKATGWFRQVYSEAKNTKAFAKVELTEKGAQLLNDGAYKYFSPEFTLQSSDPETGETITNLLIGGALTNRPFFKGMQPLMASESAAGGQSGSTGSALVDQAYFFSNSPMHKFMMLMDKLVQQTTISASEKSELEQLFAELPESDRANEKIKGPVDEVLAKFSEGDAGDGAAAPVKPAEGTEAADEEVEEPKEGDEGKEAEAAKSEAPVNVEGVKMNEDGTMEIIDAHKFTESIKGIQTNASNLSRQFREIELKKSLRNLQFSEKTQNGLLLPKHVQSFSEFALQLSEPMAKKLIELLGTIDPKAVLAFKEKGHDKTVSEANPEDPLSFTESNSEEVRYFMEHMGQPLEDAQKSAAKLAKAKAKSAK